MTSKFLLQRWQLLICEHVPSVYTDHDYYGTTQVTSVLPHLLLEDLVIPYTFYMGRRLLHLNCKLELPG